MGNPAGRGAAAQKVLPADRRGHRGGPAGTRARFFPPPGRPGPARPPGPGEPGMKGERTLLRIGGYLVGRACQRLPRKIRDDRCREWTAELPAILHDPEVRLGSHRALRMLCYAADTNRGTARAPGRTRRRRTPLSSLLIIACT